MTYTKCAPGTTTTTAHTGCASELVGKVTMSLNDCCRFCNTYLRVNGILSHTVLVFETSKVVHEKSVFERLADIGCHLSKNDKSKSTRMCSPCFRWLGRMEESFKILQRWKDRENGVSQKRQGETPSITPGSGKKLCPDPQTATTTDQAPEQTPGQASGQTPEQTPEQISGQTPEQISGQTSGQTPSATAHRMIRPSSKMPVRQSMVEVMIHYPSKKDRIKCSSDIAGIIENMAKGKWKTTINLLVRHKELFSEVIKHVLHLVEEEAKHLCNPYRGFILWKSSAEDLKTFSFEKLTSDLEKMSPLIYSICSRITKDSPLSTCASAAIALKGRESRLSAFAYYIDIVLLYGDSKKALFKKLSTLGIATSYSCAIGKQKEWASACGEGLHPLKAANKLYRQSLTVTIRAPRRNECDSDSERATADIQTSSGDMAPTDTTPTVHQTDQSVDENVDENVDLTSCTLTEEEMSELGIISFHVAW